MRILLLLSIFTFQVDPIRKPVDEVFKGMESNDSTLVRNAFVPGARMLTVSIKNGTTTVEEGDLDNFLSFIGSPKDFTVAEPIWDVEIKRDGPYATLWAQYALYMDGKLNHCGVDSFELILMDGNWKILSITDTRRKEGCDIPDDIASKYGGQK